MGYLINCFTKTGDKLKKMLKFFSCEENIPSVPFSPQPSLRFSETSLYPTSSTCSFELVLPSCHTSFESFESRMDEALSTMEDLESLDEVGQGGRKWHILI